jgi:hypothetical protein
VLDASYDRAFDFCPVDAFVELFVHEADGADVVSSNEVQTQRDLGRWFMVVGGSDDALDCAAENLIKER